MTKLTFPLSVVEVGGALFNWYYNNVQLRSDVTKSSDASNAYAVNNFGLTFNAIKTLLTNGGDVEFYLMAVHANIDLLGDTVPDGLPNRMTYNISGTQIPKTFNYWFNTGSDKWKKDDNSEIVFLTNPFAGNEDQYLKGSEIKLIEDMPNTIEILKYQDALDLVDSGWTKI
jgi:hypothetical protein